MGWYGWECYPGCLPASDAFGPFTTSYRALKDAIQGHRPVRQPRFANPMIEAGRNKRQRRNRASQWGTTACAL